MKRVIVIFSILALATVVFPAVSIVAQPEHIPHEDPATAGDSSSSLLFLLLHCDIFELATAGDYAESRDLLKQLRYANIDGDLQYIAGRLNTIADDLLKALENLEYLLDVAATHLSQYHLEKAKQYLEEARTALVKAEGLYKSIESAVLTYGDKIAVVNSPPSSEIRQAYNRLHGLFELLQQMLDQLDLDLENLFTQYEVRAGVKLLPTYLTLETTQKSVYVGDSVTVSGRLAGNDGPLKNRLVTLFREDEPVEEVVTDEEGFFSVDLVMPFEYVDITYLEAWYWPAGDDIGTFAESKSQRITLEVLYYSTSLRLMAPEVVYPGLPFIVVGVIGSSDEKITEREVTLRLDDSVLTSLTAQERFKVDIVLPDDTAVGDGVLEAVVSPDERYAGSSQQVNLLVYKMTVDVDIQAPSLIVLPRQVGVSGRVFNELDPITGARVSIWFGSSDGVIVETSEDGSFEARVEAPINLSLAGPQKLTVKIEPLQPYYGIYTADKWIVAVNPVGICLMLVGIISVGLLVYRRVAIPVRRGMNLPGEDVGGQILPDTPTIAPPMRPKHAPGGNREKVWEAYLDGLSVVEKAAGIHLGSNNTLRGFYLEAVSRLKTDIRSSFGKLTVLTEMALYSAHEMDENTVNDARQLVNAIRKEIGDAAA